MWLPQGARPGQHCPRVCVEAHLSTSPSRDQTPTGSMCPASLHIPLLQEYQKQAAPFPLCRYPRVRTELMFPQHYGPWNNVPTGQGIFPPSRDRCQASEEMNKPTRGGSLAFSTLCFCSSLILFSSINGLNIQMTNNENTVSRVTKFLTLAKCLGDAPLHA